MRIHLFIDLENTQPTAADLEQVRGPQYRLWIMHGPHQKKFHADQAKAWQPLGDHVQFVESAKHGKNALDMHIAFSIGEASERDRREGVDACYLIVSKDGDYDSLLGYLEVRKILTRRAQSLPEALQLAEKLAATLKPVQSPKPASRSPNAEMVLQNLREHEKNRPTTEKKLRNHLASFLGKKGTDAEVGRVIAELKKFKVLTIEGTKVKYSLPSK